MAIETSRFTTSHLRFRRRFVRNRNLRIALTLIILLPALVLLPGFTFTFKQLEPQEVVPPPHPPQVQTPASIHRSPHSQSHKNVLEEDKHVDQLTVHSALTPNISLVVLFHNEYSTLNHTLYTWRRLALYISDLVFFLNGIESSQEFIQRLPILTQPAFAHRRIIPSQANLPLGLAITEMVRQAKHENVLLLEKDWALIEDDVASVLTNSVTLLENAVHVVRLRHRQFPGAPLHARMMHEGRERSILAEQKNLFCYIHHWIPNPVKEYPDYFSICPGMNESDTVWCAKAKYCQWTNNPALFKKSWFLNELGARFEIDYKLYYKQDPRSNMLDFEFYTNWKREVWNDRDFVVALPRGLFEHQEIGEGGVMNTVWYAWNRLQKDVEDKRKDYLEQAGAACEGRDVEADEGLWRFEERYPVEFVRHYSYSLAMKRGMDDGVDEIKNATLVNRKRLEDGHGSWRNGVTDLTNLWYKVSLFVYPSEPRDMNIAFVTAFFHADPDDGSKVRHDLDVTVGNIVALSNYSIIIYCTTSTKNAVEDLLKKYYAWSYDLLKRIKFIVEEFDGLAERLLTTENVKRIRELRRGEKYRTRVTNRSNGIPSESSLIAAHSKPYILDDAMRHVENVTHFIWFDATSPCVSRSRGAGGGGVATIGFRNDAILRSQMLLHAVVTGVSVSTELELENALSGSGFDTGVFLKHMEKKAAQLEVVDMKTFGGSRMGVSLIMGYYDVVLRNMFRVGELGTGREAMSIVRNNVDYNFRFFDGLNGCSRNIHGTHACGRKQVEKDYMGDEGLDACQIYRWVGECNGGGGG